MMCPPLSKLLRLNTDLLRIWWSACQGRFPLLLMRQEEPKHESTQRSHLRWMTVVRDINSLIVRNALRLIQEWTSMLWNLTRRRSSESCSVSLLVMLMPRYENMNRRSSVL